jgi:signal peptidase I
VTGAVWVVRTLARAGLWVLLSLLLWSALPSLAGMPTRVVMSGSMTPVLEPGDVVVARPLGRGVPSPGQVVLFADRSEARDVVHRVVGVEGGVLTTRGDANPTPDSAPVQLGDVRGTAWLRVPFAGLPRLWLVHRDLGALGGAVALVTGLFVAAVDWRRPQDPPPAPTS